MDEATLAELGELVPMYEELAQTAKVHLLQSIVSKVLVEMVFDAYFVGLSNGQTRDFRQMEELLSSFGTYMFKRQVVFGCANKTQRPQTNP